MLDYDNRPVRYVFGNDAQAYCQWLTDLRVLAQRPVAERSGLELGGLEVRLPTEAEWEKAARGNDKRIFSWQGEFDPDKANVVETGIGTTSAVGCFPNGASPYGCLDMIGNVWEWTNSKKEKYPYKNDGREDGKGDSFVVRGGARNNNGVSARCAFRNDDTRYLHDNDTVNYLWHDSGFRVVVSSIS
ncbi:MAG: SUMF1/EgtB/PvdO family nonheme iron enzyme [Chloroflexi bacterium]|nr:SUMF1/EgtB/PvdO family nonheme iron enzyme [Chloroflexota bacterium]